MELLVLCDTGTGSVVGKISVMTVRGCLTGTDSEVDTEVHLIMLV